MAVVAADVLGQIAFRLHLTDPAQLSPFWPGIVPWALQLAQSELYSVLAARGMTVQTIDAWTGADPWVMLRAVYHAMMAGAGQEDVNLDAIKQADEASGLKALREVSLTDDTGAAIKGSAIGTGSISGGWDDAKKKEYDPSRLGFIDPRTGRLRKW
jgi:hypothetical protein